MINLYGRMIVIFNNFTLHVRYHNLMVEISILIILRQSYLFLPSHIKKLYRLRYILVEFRSPLTLIIDTSYIYKVHFYI